jgi:hypothetical protein
VAVREEEQRDMRKKVKCDLWKLVFTGKVNAVYYCDENYMSVWFDRERQRTVLSFRGSEDVEDDGFTPIGSKPVHMNLNETSYSIHHRTSK